MRVNKYVLIGLVVIVVLALYVTFFAGGKKKMELAAASLEPPKIAAPPPEVRAKEARVQAIQENMEWERDPFTLPAFLMVEKKAEKQRVPLKLLAIMEGARGRVAIIDNEVVGKGDIVAGERVAEIGKETVTLIQDGSKRVITIQEPR
ncbi:MAG TPA: hypothetical protein VKF36_19980 [Syntrophorhabdales bacterium]|nr:hypothetical protein [Syntrophorhabdales bacterium]